MGRKPTSKKIYYFPERLKNELAQIPYHPLTLVEAPSGFGKTTAVREYFKDNIPKDACQHWYTCLGEPAAFAWKGICDLFANIDVEIATKLRKLEIPTMDTLRHILSILKDLHCMAETYLVIDNYQLFSCDIPRELISVFSMHESPSLHMIVIAQHFGTKPRITFHNANIHTFDPSAFFFDRESTLSLFRMEGIHLSEEEAKCAHKYTEGWVSAIRLQIINFKQTGSLGRVVGMKELVEAAIFNRLSPEEKVFLLSVSVMNSFTPRQAAIMINMEFLPANIERLLNLSDFIRYIPDKNVYTMHNILRDYLLNRFYHYYPEELQKQIYKKAGQSYVALSQYYPAAQFFFKAGDFDSIMSMPFNAEYIGNQKEEYILEFMEEVVDKCPEETLLDHPFVMLIFSSQLYVGGYLEMYKKLHRLLGLVIEKNSGLSPGELRTIKGEFLLMTSQEAFNNIREMEKRQREAWDILGGPSRQVKNGTAFTFGCPSVLFMFWRAAGELDSALLDMRRWLPVYRKLTSGQGAGADSVMRAEALLMRGEDREAEILSHKALYEARSCQQICICLCAELVLARIAILRGDDEGYLTAIKNIKGYASGNFSLYVLRMVDLCLCIISILLDSREDVAPWFFDMESIKKTLYPYAISYTQVFYCKMLIDMKRYGEFFGLSRLIFEADAQTDNNRHYMISQVYNLKHLAQAHLELGELAQAQEYFTQALAVSLPDKIYLPFAQQPGVFYALMELARDSCADVQGVNAILKLCKRYEKGLAVIQKVLYRSRSPLTPREREIAIMARDRLRKSEIAKKLYISEATVKVTLDKIYRKLGVHSKAELGSVVF